MNRILILKGEHEEIIRECRRIDEIICGGNFNYINFIYSFNKLLSLLTKHEENEESFLNSLKGKTSFEISHNPFSLNNREIRGHLELIRASLRSKDPTFIKLALENDGVMLTSKIEDHIFYEEKLFNKLLFLNPFRAEHDIHVNLKI